MNNLNNYNSFNSDFGDYANHLQFLITELITHTIYNYFKRFPTKYVNYPNKYSKISYVLDSYVHTYCRPEFKYLRDQLTDEQIDIIFQEILDTISILETGY